MKLNLHGYREGQAAGEQHAVAIVRSETALTLAFLLTIYPLDLRFEVVGGFRYPDAQPRFGALGGEWIVAELIGDARFELAGAGATESRFRVVFEYYLEAARGFGDRVLATESDCQREPEAAILA